MSDRNTDPEQGARNIRHLLHRIGHYSAYLILALCLGGAAISVALLFGARFPGQWERVANVATYGVGGLAILSAIVHFGGLCERCIAAMPLDGPEKAARWSRTLRLNHTLLPRTRRDLTQEAHYTPVLLLVLAPLAALVVLLPDPAGGGVAGLVLSVLVAVFIFTELRHDLVRPWCPYCRRWDEGGGREPSPILPTSPAHSR